MASTISAFADWLLDTEPARLSGPDELMNDAVLNTYVISDALNGASQKKIVRGGTYIQDNIRLANQGDYAPFKPGSELNTLRIPTKARNTWAWRHYRNSYPAKQHELDFNEGDQFVKFKNYKDEIMTEIDSEHYTGMEAAMWKVPSQADMEPLGNDEGFHFSIPAYITENLGTGPYRAPGWGTGTLAGVDPDDWDAWRNQQNNFDDSAPDDPDTGLFQAFDAMLDLLEFQPPPQLSGKIQVNDKLDKLFIYTNNDGKNMVSRLLRAGNTYTRQGPQDASYHSPIWNGDVPIKRVSTLNTVLLDEDNGAYTNQAYPAGKPRFFWVNWKWMFPVFHPKHFMNLDMEEGGARYPQTRVFIRDTSMQLICRSRKRQGITRPLSAAS